MTLAASVEVEVEAVEGDRAIDFHDNTLQRNE
jgi:hypothetical protein